MLRIVKNYLQANAFARKFSCAAILCLVAAAVASAQGDPEKPAEKNKEKQKNQVKVRPMTIPISIFSKEELKTREVGEILEAGELTVREANDEQQILSIRSVTGTPLHIAVLIQDNLTSAVNLQLDEIRTFVRKLPPDSRVMVGYLRSGSPQVVQKFTTDLDKASKSIRAVVGAESVAPNSPFEGLDDILDRFDALPTGRRAVLLVSDGFDVNNPQPGQSLALDRAILKAQRRSVAVYSFFASGTATEAGTSSLVLAAQSSLEKLADETGGRAYFQGSFTPVNFEPFFRDLNLKLSRQFALTYLSTHPKKGYYKIQVTSTNPAVKIEHPNGYYYRGN